jgi:hypothetical protein
MCPCPAKRALDLNEFKPGLRVRLFSWADAALWHASLCRRNATFGSSNRCALATDVARRISMTKSVLAFACIFAMSSSAAWAQVPSATNCPAPTAGETTGAKGSGGLEKPESQPVERSAILPNAGGHQESAAPSVKQDGEDVVAQTECPKPPNRIDAPKTQ